MKKFITKFAPWVILGVLLILLIPGISLRITSEAKNTGVTMVVYYDSMMNKLSAPILEKTLSEMQNNGINNAIVSEEDLNYMVSKGDITCIKYNQVLHKYDDQSIEIGNVIAEKCKDITHDSYVIIVDNAETDAKIKQMLSKKYTEKDYADIGQIGTVSVYVFFDGRQNLWDITVGFNEDSIKALKANGFDVALMLKVKNYTNLKYLEDIDRIVKEYDVEFLNLKPNSVTIPKDKQIKENYEGLADIINSNDMTLVVTENPGQLGNQVFMGYEDVFESVMGEGGSKKVVRSYETYDESQADSTKYKYRVEQFFNSTLDRNIRFITLTLISPSGPTYEECAENTVKAAKMYKEKIENAGFTVNEPVEQSNYTANRSFNFGICAAIMVMCALLMIQLVLGIRNIPLTVAAVVLAVLSFAATYVLPHSLTALYPTLFCVVQSCFAMTVALSFVKAVSEKLNFFILAVSTVALVLVTLFLGAMGMGTMLSGLDYYINNEIFRGIKISLIAPIAYTAIIFYLMFMRTNWQNTIDVIKKLLVSDIKVYWVLIAGVLGYIGMYYIVRSGNVNSISFLEATMRSKLTELFSARPRTKEFLIGYPALVMFVYYMKKSDFVLFKWLLAIGASILTASVTNSFCHVFTDFTTIISRTVNGLIVGIIVSIFVYFAHLVFAKIVDKGAEKLDLPFRLIRR